MKKRTPLTRLLWLMVPLLLLGLVSFASAKYIKTIEKEGTVTFTAKLAESFIVQEHVVERQSDGRYTLSTTDTTTSGQSYILIPGLDIPKDPHVVITDKTEIPAYLYIEIEDTLESYDGAKVVAYTPSSDWRKTTESDQKNGDNIYVYTGGGSDPLALTDTNTPAKIYILENNTVTVSQHVKHAVEASTDGTDVIKIYAYLVEVPTANS